MPSSVFAKRFYVALPYDGKVCVIQNGEESFADGVEAYNIEGLNYFKLRDLSLIMDFSLSYDTNTEVISINTKSHSAEKSTKAEKEPTSAVTSKQKLFIDGQKIENLTVFNINGYNYFSIRGLCDSINLECIWSEKEKKISINMDKSKESDVIFISIDVELNIDLEKGDIAELTDYLDKNIPEFDKNTCMLELINKQSDDGDYLVMYTMYQNELKTPYGLLVFIDADGTMDYVNKLNNAISDVSFDISEDKIEKAKQKAINNYEGCTVVEQKVEKCLDLDSKPYIYVKTTYQDGGAYFVEEYKDYVD